MKQEPNSVLTTTKHRLRVIYDTESGKEPRSAIRAAIGLVDATSFSAESR